MYNPFLKVKPRMFSSPSGESFNLVLHPFNKSSMQNDEPTQLTEYLNVDFRELVTDIPNSENYQLRDLLKLGYVPQEVIVAGLLDPEDSLDSRNQDFINFSLDAIEKYNENVESTE